MKKLVLLLLLSTGCIGVPREQKRQETIKDSAALASNHDSEFKQKIVAQTPPTIHTESDPKTGKIITDITPAPASTTTHYKENNNVKASQNNALWYESMDSIPVFVKMIGFGVAVLFLLWIFFYIRKQSAAVAAAAQLTDDVLASQIQRAREKAMLASDHKDIAAHMTDVAALEAKRGRIVGKKKT